MCFCDGKKILGEYLLSSGAMQMMTKCCDVYIVIQLNSIYHLLSKSVCEHLV